MKNEEMLMTTMDKAKVTLPSDREVCVTRSFKAPSALVYKAYTTPELLQRWMVGPPGWTMPVCEMDVRVGGKFRWRWRDDSDGKEFGFHGEFTEVEPGVRLAHTELYDPGDVGGNMGESGEALIVVEFSESAGVTTVTSRMDFGSKHARDAAMSTGMTDGMEMSYQKLDALLLQAA